MLNKPSDVPYCGVSEDKIKNTRLNISDEKLDRLCFYINERYKIHIRKDILHQEQPYTDNVVLQTYKFTNVRREHDRATRWMIDNITNSSQDLYERIYKTILYRLFAKIETAELLDLYTDNVVDNDMVELARNRTKYLSDYKVFTNAYFTSGIKGSLNKSYPEESSFITKAVMVVRDLRDNNFAERLMECDSQDKVFNMFKALPCMGRFLAYQEFVDLTYIPEFKFSENEFVITGPGCENGIRTLTDNNTNGLSYEEVCFWLRDNLVEEAARRGYELDPKTLFSDLPEYDRVLNVMSIENIMCEYKKFMQLSDPESKYTRVRYTPYKHESPLNLIS